MAHRSIPRRVHSDSMSQSGQLTTEDDVFDPPMPDNFKQMLGLFVVVVIAVAIIVTWLLR